MAVKSQRPRETVSFETPLGETDRPADDMHGDMLGVVRLGEPRRSVGGHRGWLPEANQGPPC